MESTLKSKIVNYGLIEVRDGGTSPRYRLYVAGRLRESSDDLGFILREFELCT